MFRRFAGLLACLIVLSAFLSGCGDSGSSPAVASPTTQIANPVVTLTTAASVTTQATTPPQSPTVATNNPTTASATAVVATVVPSQSAAKLSGKIVYSTAAPENAVYLINPDGSQRLKLANGSGPIFSPDSKRIAYRETINDTTSDELTVAIRSINLDGSDKQTYCTLGTGTGMLIRWSPRNRYIASTRWQTGPGNISLCDLESKKNSTFGVVGQPANLMAFDWSPDGNSAVWQTVTSPASTNPLTAELFYGDPDKNGTGGTKLTSGQFRPKYAADLYQYYTAARISPDGKTVAVAGSRLFFLNVPGQNSSLAGKSLEKLGEVYQMAWSPDGKALAVTVCKESIADGCNKRALVIVDLATEQITPLAENVFSADWSR